MASAPSYSGPACGLEAVGCIDVCGIAALSWTCIKNALHQIHGSMFATTCLV